VSLIKRAKQTWKKKYAKAGTEKKKRDEKEKAKRNKKPPSN